MIFETENWIVKERISRNLSQYKLAKLLDIANTKLCSWEKGKTEPSNNEIEFIREKIEEFDTKFATGKVSLKKFYQGKPIERSQPRYLTSSEWEHLAFSYPKSYLAGKSVSQTKPLTRRPTAIALFAGCGGMSLGFKWAGFDVKGYVELERAAREIYKTNFPKARELGADILELTDEQIASWKKDFGNIDVLCGGPPCQGFSLAGKRNEADYRNKLYREYQRIAEIVRPKAFVLENVRLLTSMREEDGSSVVQNIISGFNAIGYSVTFKVLNSAEFGVPQARERVIFIGVDKSLGIWPSLPEETHTFDETTLFEKKKVRTFRDACKDLDSIEAGGASSQDPLHWAITHPEHCLEWLRRTPEGKSAHENEDPSMRPPSGYNTTYKRLRWDEPSSTISTNFNMISGSRNVHPTSTRSLTIREAMRCQSFPDDFKVVGNWMDVRKAIGNAVPPILAERIANHVIQNVLFYE